MREPPGERLGDDGRAWHDARVLLALDAEQIVRRGAEDAGELGDQLAVKQQTTALVLRDDGLGDFEPLGEFHLGDAPCLADLSEPVTDGLGARDGGDDSLLGQDGLLLADDCRHGKPTSEIGPSITSCC